MPHMPAGRTASTVASSAEPSSSVETAASVASRRIDTTWIKTSAGTEVAWVKARGWVASVTTRASTNDGNVMSDVGHVPYVR